MMTELITPKLTRRILDHESKIRKIMVGETNPNAAGQEKVLMLVGATGSGKTTLINAFTNYIMGVKYDESRRYVLIDEETQGSQAHSQTKWITAYTFHQQDNLSRLPYTFTIIDTPGYGDTAGLGRDKEITQQIKKFFSLEGPHRINELHGVGFVAPSHTAPLTPIQKYVIDSVLSIMGKNMAGNLLLMLSFADGNEPLILRTMAEENINYAHYFTFNNTSPQTQNQISPRSNTLKKCFWETGENSFQEFFDVFSQTASVNLDEARENLKLRDELECIVEGLRPQVKLGLSILDQAQQEECKLKDHRAKMLASDFKFQIDVTKRRKVDLHLGTYATNCNTCYITCHMPCITGNNTAQCRAINRENGMCQVCPRKCHWKDHENSSYYFDSYYLKETVTLQDLQKKYTDAKNKVLQKEQVLEGLKKNLKTINEAVFVMISRIKTILQRLDEIAMKPIPRSELDYIDLIIDDEKRERREGWARRVAAFQDIRAHIEISMKNEQFLHTTDDAIIKYWDFVKQNINF